MEAQPTSATLVGDHRFDDRIEDLSVEAEDRLAAGWRALADQVEAVPPAELDATDQVTRSLLAVELARGIEGLDRRLTELASDQMDGVHAWLLTSAPELSAPTPESAAALVERHRQVGALLDQAGHRFRAGLGAGRTPARVVVERALNQVDGYLASDLADDPFVTFPGPEGWGGEVAWRDQLAAAAREEIRPAFQRYRDVLADELLPVARPDERCGLTWLGADGADLYRTLVRQHTTLDDLSADEIHQIGLAEIERLAGEYAEVGGRLFGTRDLGEVFSRLRTTRPCATCGATRSWPTPSATWRAPRRPWGSGSGACPRRRAPSRRCPTFLAADAPAAYYFPPAADGSRPGAYFVNTHEPERQEPVRDRLGGVPRGHPRPSPAAHDRQRARPPAPVPAPELRQHGLRRGLGALHRAAGRRDGPLPRRRRAHRHAGRRLVAVVPPGRRHRHARPGLEPPAGDRLHGGQRPGGRRRDHRSRSTATSPSPGQALAYKVGQLEIQRLRRRGRGGVGRRVRHPRLPRRRARVGLGQPAGAARAGGRRPATDRRRPGRAALSGSAACT